MSAIERQLEQWRRELLDLSLRNPLLSFRTQGTGAIRLVEPDGTSIFRTLVEDQRGLVFYRTGSTETEQLVLTIDSSAEADLSTSGEAADEIVQQRPLRQNEVRAELEQPVLDRRLYRIYLKSRTSILEQGINTLYVSFGLLRWNERPGGELAAAPLLLVPVQLGRKSALDPFEIEPYDDEMTLNPTLVEKMRNGFNITLGLSEEDLQQPLPSILDVLKRALAGNPEWKVTPDVFLSQFQFHKLSMYRDLAQYAGEASAHPLIRLLCGDATAAPGLPADLPGDRELDSRVSPRETFHVLDADASQMKVVLAASREPGASFVVQGPPGTGKSQTITNVIAETLARKKRVLFVSEKAAALEVVHRRLSAAGLADYCLELHSHRANKKTVLEELGRVLDLADSRRPRPEADLFDELVDCRSQLNQYADALLTERQPLGLSCYEVHGRLASLADAPNVPWDLPDPGRLTPTRILELRRAIGRLADVHAVFLEGSSHPWFGFVGAAASLSQTAQALGTLGSLDDALTETVRFAQELEVRYGLPGITSLADLSDMSATLVLAGRSRVVPSEWFSRSTLQPLRETARTARSTEQNYHQHRREVLERYDQRILAEDLGDVSRVLSDALPVAEFARSGMDARDRVVQERESILSLLGQVALRFERFREVAAPVAAILGEPMPKAVAEARRLLDLMDLVISQPAAAASWFDLGSSAETAVSLRRAAEAKTAVSARLPELLQRADRGLLDLATEDFVARYAAYGWWRVFSPSYRRDKKQFAGLWKEPTNFPSHAEQLDLLREAQSIRTQMEWFKKERAALSNQSGVADPSEKTDWEGVRAAFDRFLAFGRTHALPESEQGRRALMATSTDVGMLVQLRDQFREATDALALTVPELLSAAPHAAVFIPSGGVGAVDQESLSQLAARMLQDVRRLLSAYDLVCSFKIRPHSPPIAELSEDLRSIKALIGLEREVAHAAERWRQQFGALYDGSDSSWASIIEAIDWVEQLGRRFSTTPPPAAFVQSLVAPESAAEFRMAAERAGRLVRSIEDGLTYFESQFVDTVLRVDGRPVRGAG